MSLVLGSIYAHRLLLLALVLSTLSHVSHSKGDVNVMFLRGLIEAIFLFDGVKGVFLAINRIKGGLRLSVINYINNGLRLSAINYQIF